MRRTLSRTWPGSRNKDTEHLSGKEQEPAVGLEPIRGGRLEGSSRPTDSVKPSFLMES